MCSSVFDLRSGVRFVCRDHKTNGKLHTCLKHVWCSSVHCFNTYVSVREAIVITLESARRAIPCVCARVYSRRERSLERGQKRERAGRGGAVAVCTCVFISHGCFYVRMMMNHVLF